MTDSEAQTLRNQITIMRALYELAARVVAGELPHLNARIVETEKLLKLNKRGVPQ